MTDNQIDDGRQISKNQLFQVFLKTGRKRVALSIICGTIIFLTMTSLVMAVYNYRFATMIKYQDEIYNWFNDDYVSVGSIKKTVKSFDNFSDTFFGELNDEFSNMITDLYPTIGFQNTSFLISGQFYEYVGLPEPLYHSISTLDNRSYEIYSHCLIEGRLPNNYSELLVYSNPDEDLNVNDTLTLYAVSDSHTQDYNFTIVGILGNFDENLENYSVSRDVFDYQFRDIPIQPINYNTFLTNNTLFGGLLRNLTYYNGYISYLLDVDFNCRSFRLNKVEQYVSLIPGSNELVISPTINAPVELCYDLRSFLLYFNDLWVIETTKILAINAPLVFILGLLTVVTLNIGSRELGSVFRRMKLYGLSYNSMRGMILLENIIVSFLSLALGFGSGFVVSYLVTYKTPNLPANFYVNYLTEPLLIACLIGFTLGFYLLSFIIQNRIAKSTAREAHEEFQRKRGKIRQIFSTNEFRIVTVAIIFSAISGIMYLIYINTIPEDALTANVTYLTIVMFMVMISAAFVITFVFLILARLITLLWSLLENRIWPNKLNIFSLSVKHLSANRDIYQIAILSTMIFGLVVLPGMAMDRSINTHLAKEADMAIGNSNLAVLNWIDSENELDAVLANITEIEYFTEVVYYNMHVVTEDESFRIYMLGLKSPTNFTLTINSAILNSTILTLDDITALENDSTVLFNKKFAQQNNLLPGDVYSTKRFAQYYDDIIFANSFELFPLLPIPERPIFSSNLEVFSIIGNRETTTDIAGSLNLDAEVDVNNVKLIKVTNESAIPIVQEKLDSYNITTTSFDDMYSSLFGEVESFTESNLLLFAILSALSLVFVSYFTGTRIFEERGRIIESLYRVGAVRGQLLGIFTFEYIVINLLPLIVTILASLPLFKYLAVYTLGTQEIYYPFQPGLPFWVYLITILCGIAISLVGWLLAVVPLIYRYRPVKQE